MTGMFTQYLPIFKAEFRRASALAYRAKLTRGALAAYDAGFYAGFRAGIVTASLKRNPPHQADTPPSDSTNGLHTPSDQSTPKEISHAFPSNVPETEQLIHEIEDYSQDFPSDASPTPDVWDVPVVGPWHSLFLPNINPLPTKVHETDDDDMCLSHNFPSDASPTPDVWDVPVVRETDDHACLSHDFPSDASSTHAYIYGIPHSCRTFLPATHGPVCLRSTQSRKKKKNLPTFDDSHQSIRVTAVEETEPDDHEDLPSYAMAVPNRFRNLPSTWSREKKKNYLKLMNRKPPDSNLSTFDLIDLLRQEL
ncbi:hypothetical protein BU15DRAFT_65791 [Melanogaster broomeanus]|nr:hypothetical protein BU15DRAFT_65791 [Melanogaster broomeanus]